MNHSDVSLQLRYQETQALPGAAGSRCLNKAPKVLSSSGSPCLLLSVLLISAALSKPQEELNLPSLGHRPTPVTRGSGVLKLPSPSKPLQWGREIVQDSPEGKGWRCPKKEGNLAPQGEKKLHCSHIRQIPVLIYTAGTRSELYSNTSSKISTWPWAFRGLGHSDPQTVQKGRQTILPLLMGKLRFKETR